MNTDADTEQPRPVSDTPRTDAASETIYSESIFGRHIVDVDFARQIERELSEAKQFEHYIEVPAGLALRVDTKAKIVIEALEKKWEELETLKTENAHLRSVLESIYNEGRGSEVFPPSPDDGHDGLKFLAVQQALNPSPNDTRH